MAQTTLQDTRFKQMPTPEDLIRMSRDLRYHPVRNDHPAVLTSAQIDTFNEQGYLKPFRIYSDEEIDAIRDEFDGMIEQVMARGDHNYSIISAHLKSGMVHDIMNDPRIVAYISDLLGDDVVGWGAHFFCKLPGDGKIVNWHQDASFWPLSPSKTVTAWLAIDDADTENACMRFVAGSHHYGHLTYHMSEEAENNVLNQTVRGSRDVRHRGGHRTQGGRDLAAQRPAAAWIRAQYVGPTPLRPDAQVLRRLRPRRTQLEQGRRDRQGIRSHGPLGGSAAAGGG